MGGEYYIISRSFGLVIGSTIGMALYLSQAISVAFYIMAFTEAFKPLIDWLRETYVLLPWVDNLLGYPQTIGIPALLLLTAYSSSPRGPTWGSRCSIPWWLPWRSRYWPSSWAPPTTPSENAVEFFNSYTCRPRS